MKSLKTASAALILSLFVVSASAQPQQRKAPQGGGERPTAEKTAEIATDRLDQKLELSDSQESKIYAINLKYAKQREANKSERAEKPERTERPTQVEIKAMQEERKAVQEAAQKDKKAQMTEIMKVLSDEQKVEYALLIGNDKAKRGGQGGPRQGAQQGKGPQQGQGAPRQGAQQGKGGQGGPQGGPQGKEGKGEQRPERGERPAPQDAE